MEPELAARRDASPRLGVRPGRRLAAVAAPGAVVLLGLALRVDLVLRHNAWQPNTAAWLIGDEPGYNNLALELLQGLGFTWPGRVPLYPALLAGLHWLTDSSYHDIRLLQALLGALVVWLTYRLGARIFGRAAGLAAGALAAVSYVLTHQSLHLLSEVLFTPVLLGAALALWGAFERPTAGRFAWAGLWLGVSDLVRPTMLMFPVFLILVLGLTHGRKAALRWGGVYLAAVMVVIGPWIVRNYVRYGALFPLATSNAILWQGSPEYYRLIHEQGYTYMRIWSEVLYGPGWRAHDPTSVEGDRWWTRRALRSIGEDPATYLKYAAEKVGTYWVGDPNADWGDSRVFDYQALRRIGFGHRAAIEVIIARALPIVALIAVLVLRRRGRRLLPIYAILAYTTLLHAATHAEARLSEPFQPFLLVLIVGACLSGRATSRAPAAARAPA